MRSRPTHCDARRIAKLGPCVCGLLTRPRAAATPLHCALRIAALFVGLLAPGLPPQQDSVLAAQTESEAPRSTDTSTPPAKLQQDAKLFVLVEGQITDYIGAGQEGVSVTVYRKNADDSPGEIIATTTTDKLGDFVIRTPELIRGDVVITFSKPLYSDLTRELHIDDDEYPPYLAEVLTGKLVVIGRVIDALTDKPVAEASVTLKAQYTDWL